MKKSCQNCGEELVHGAKFCDGCGEEYKEPPKEEKKEEHHEPKKHQGPKKHMPTWFIIVSLVFSGLLILQVVGGIVGLWSDIFQYALIVYGLVGIAALFYIFCIILFMAKHYERSCFTLPWLFLFFNFIFAGFVFLATAMGVIFTLPAAGWTLIGIEAAINFLLLCFGLYYLLREH
jgi:hypothetical protein